MNTTLIQQVKSSAFRQKNFEFTAVVQVHEKAVLCDNLLWRAGFQVFETIIGEHHESVRPVHEMNRDLSQAYRRMK